MAAILDSAGARPFLEEVLPQEVVTRVGGSWRGMSGPKDGVTMGERIKWVN